MSRRQFNQAGKPLLRMSQVRAQLLNDNIVDLLDCHVDGASARSFFFSGGGGYVIQILLFFGICEAHLEKILLIATATPWNLANYIGGKNLAMGS